MGTKRIIIVMRNPMVMTQTSKIANHLGNPACLNFLTNGYKA